MIAQELEEGNRNGVILTFFLSYAYTPRDNRSTRRERCRRRLGIADRLAAPAVGWIRDIPHRVRRDGPGGITTSAPKGSRPAPTLSDKSRADP
jgi:hypothetical protein